MVRSINPSSLPHHSSPIPLAAVHRGLLVSSAISGIDPVTARYLSDKEAQFALAFSHLRQLLEASGATLQDVVKLDLFFADKADRPLVNPHWLDMYPDEGFRPARHAHQGSLPSGCWLQIEVMAILERTA